MDQFRKYRKILVAIANAVDVAVGSDDYPKMNNKSSKWACNINKSRMK